MPGREQWGKIFEQKALGTVTKNESDPFYGEISGKLVEYVNWSDRLTFLLNRVKSVQPKVTSENPEKIFPKRIVSEVQKILSEESFQTFLKDWKVKSVSFYTAVGSPLDKLGVDGFVEVFREPIDDRKRMRKDVVTIDITTNPRKLDTDKVRADIIVRFQDNDVNPDGTISDTKMKDVALFVGRAIVEKFKELALQENSFENRGHSMYSVDSGNLTRGVEKNDRRETGKLDMWGSYPGSGNGRGISSVRY